MNHKISLINRLDVFVKVLYIRAFLSGKNYSYFRKFYTDHIRLYNGSKEDHKKNTTDFVNDFNKLIESFKNNGFDDNYPIPLNKGGELLNGAHRLACCIYFGIEPVYKNTSSNIPINWGLGWFKNNGFSQENIIDIIEEYNKFSSVDLIILWPRYHGKINEISQLLKQEGITYLGAFNLNFSKPGFIEFTNDLYAIDNQNIASSIYKKGVELAKIGTQIKILILGENSTQLTKKLKEKIRKEIKEKNDIGYNTFHFGDNENERSYIKKIILNSNNINNINYRSGIISKDFLLKIESLNQFLKENNISKDEVSIVGSGSLGVFGIHHVSDIDIIQKEISDKGVIKKGEIDILDYQYFEKITNKDIIENKRNHFYFRGFKFINLELLKTVKALQGYRSKDVEQAKKIQKFLEKNNANPSKLDELIFEMYFLRNLIKIHFIKFVIHITKKIGLYKTISYYWRKYILKNIK